MMIDMSLWYNLFPLHMILPCSFYPILNHAWSDKFSFQSGFSLTNASDLPPTHQYLLVVRDQRCLPCISNRSVFNFHTVSICGD